jgi:hypothetical protein
MPQIGSISISPDVNTQAMINLLKEDKKITIGQEQIAPNGSRYIPIEKNG